MIKRIKSLAK